MMFIDVNTYVGHWPFRELTGNTLDGLDKLAQANGITHMVVSNIEGFFYKRQPLLFKKTVDKILPLCRVLKIWSIREIEIAFFIQ